MIIRAKEPMRPLVVRLPKEVRDRIKTVVKKEREMNNNISEADVVRGALDFFFDGNITDCNNQERG